MYWLSKSIHWMGRFRRRSMILLAVIGPGIITMVADNDAGGISTYAEQGQKPGSICFGRSSFSYPWPTTSRK